jgi:DeoR/GlpR family transcriptional regulator of sugar metabolism
LRREKILGALKNAEKSLTVDELSQRTGIDVARLRVDLFRLMGEGKVERRQKGNELTWALKVSVPIEERYEKLSKKYTP